MREVTAVIDGVRTHDLNLDLADGMFTPYRTDILNRLRSSTFIAYRFAPTEHYVSYILNQELGLWVPLQGWEGVITLADWIKTFDESGGMDAALTTMKQRINMNPIDQPRTYWAYFWTDFTNKFNQSQMIGDTLVQAKNEKLASIQNAQLTFNTEISRITWVFCNG